MKLTPAIAIARKVAGCRQPVEDKVCCRYCGAARCNTQMFRRYRCVRHGFYVHSRGICNYWQKEPYNPPAPPPPPGPPFTQEEMFK